MSTPSGPNRGLGADPFGPVQLLDHVPVGAERQPGAVPSWRATYTSLRDVRQVAALLLSLIHI